MAGDSAAILVVAESRGKSRHYTAPAKCRLMRLASSPLRIDCGTTQPVIEIRCGCAGGHMSKLSTMIRPRYAKYGGLLVVCILLIGVSAYSAVTERLALGTIARYDPYGGPASVFMRRFTIAPGEVLGWHYHPGVGAYSVVNKGTLVKEDGCGGFEVFSPNEAFVEHPNRVHRGGNLGTEPIETIQAFVVPLQSDGGRNSGWLPPGTAVATTVNVPGRLCGPPAEVQECQQGGWIKFDHPRRFASQADCEQFIGTGK